MITPQPKDTIHKAWLYRLLTAFADDPILAQILHFKGGTCAAMRGIINRFSIDLDFDVIINKKNSLRKIKTLCEKVFARLGLQINDQSQKGLQYFLKYPAKEGQRNTIKFDTNFPPPKSNQYEHIMLSEIDRVISCQTIATMMANKLVALIDRYEKTKGIAGRDLYDIHEYLIRGVRYNAAIIKERRQQTPVVFFQTLIKFIDQKITQRLIDEDINVLLLPEEFRQIRKQIKPETIMMLKDEIERLKK